MSGPCPRTRSTCIQLSACLVLATLAMAALQGSATANWTNLGLAQGTPIAPLPNTTELNDRGTSQPSPLVAPLRATQLPSATELVRPTAVNGTIPIATITVGSNPEAAALDTANGDVYVANGGSNSLTVLDGATDKVVGNVTVGTQPEGIAYDSSNGYLYVDLYGDSGLGHLSDVTVVNGATNSVVGSVPVGMYPLGIAYDPSNGDIYVANAWSNNVTVIDGASDTVVGSITVGAVPSGLTVGDSNVYVANQGSSNVTVIDAATNSVVDSIAGGPAPSGLAYDMSTGFLFITEDLMNGTVRVVNTSDFSLVTTLVAGVEPLEAAFDSSNGNVYVTNSNLRNVTVINGSTAKVVNSLPAGRPRGE